MKVLLPRTKVFVVSKSDGHVSETTLDGWHLSLVGGSRWEDYEVLTDRQDAEDAAEKYKLIHHLSQMLGSLEPAAAVPATQAMIAGISKS